MENTFEVLHQRLKYMHTEAVRKIEWLRPRGQVALIPRWEAERDRLVRILVKADLWGTDPRLSNEEKYNKLNEAYLTERTF